MNLAKLIGMRLGVVALGFSAATLAMAQRPSEGPGEATEEALVYVVNRCNEPIQAAEIWVLTKKDESTYQLLQKLQTDEDGKALITLPALDLDMAVGIVKQGYQTVLLSNRKAEYRWVLDRKLTQHDIDLLNMQLHPVIAQVMLFSLIAERNETIFPYIGQLRPHLVRLANVSDEELAAARERASGTNDFGLSPFEPSLRAIELLNYWGDSRDQHLFGEGIPVPPGMTREDVEGVMERWAEHELRGFRTPPHLHHSVVYSTDRERALVHWTYWMRAGTTLVMGDLLLVRSEDTWQIERNFGATHCHGIH